METINDVARTALAIQDAVNLQAVLNTWAKVQSVVRADAERLRIDYRRHPVNIMFMSKVASLMVITADCIGGIYKGGQVEGYSDDLFVAAYGAVSDLAAAKAA